MNIRNVEFNQNGDVSFIIDSNKFIWTVNFLINFDG
jgi:hypothetical protein